MSLTTVTSTSTLPDLKEMEQIVLGNGTTFTTTLPSAANNINRRLKLKKIADNTSIWTISGTIDGGSSKLISLKDTCLTLVSDGSEWKILDVYLPYFTVDSFTTPSRALTGSAYTDYSYTIVHPGHYHFQTDCVFDGPSSTYGRCITRFIYNSDIKLGIATIPNMNSSQTDSIMTVMNRYYSMNVGNNYDVQNYYGYKSSGDIYLERLHISLKLIGLL